ncbi:pre-mRNA-splicing factor cwf23 [Solanum tuberosum]|uniref:Chaperone protein DNAj n=1 Tax=Solanum tuberosum TaxID=4113 RepID=M1BF07_SOLTU|nr:PREDICTED: pre-mRNA-splicing factor cwf23 [Solanum tuberosum]
MSNLRSICRPQVVYFSITCCCRDLLGKSAVRVSTWNLNSVPRWTKPPVLQSWYHTSSRIETWDHRLNQQRKMVTTSAYNWNDSKSPYETLELEGDADEEQIKVSYRRLAKFYHPDVYNGRGTLEEGETAEARFIKIQAAYELLIDADERRNYDKDNRVNPMKASEAWVEWLMKKRKAFDQRGDMAIAAWAEQQQLELNLKARRLARSKMDPEEERRIIAKERKASVENFNNTLKRHTLVLRKRDIMRRKAEEEKKRVISRLLAAEGLELAEEDDKNL